MNSSNPIIKIEYSKGDPDEIYSLTKDKFEQSFSSLNSNDFRKWISKVKRFTIIYPNIIIKLADEEFREN